MKRKFTWGKALSLLAILQGFTAAAQSFVASELVATDATTGAPGDTINDLEFYDNGLYWTIPPRAAGPEFSHEGGLAFMAQRDTPFSKP